MLKRGILTASEWNHEGIVVGLLLQTDGEGEFPLLIDGHSTGLLDFQKALIEVDLLEQEIKNDIYYKVLSFNVLKDFNQGD